MPFLDDNKIVLDIVGPNEEKYQKQLKEIIKKLKLNNRVKFVGPVYDLSKKIKIIDSAKIYVLPSLTEAMPQSLIEAMAREKIVIASKTPGAEEIIDNGKNGFLFKIGDYKDLADKINFALHNHTNTGKKARISVEKFSWKIILNKIETLIA